MGSLLLYQTIIYFKRSSKNLKSWRVFHPLQSIWVALSVMASKLWSATMPRRQSASATLRSLRISNSYFGNMAVISSRTSTFRASRSRFQKSWVSSMGQCHAPYTITWLRRSKMNSWVSLRMILLNQTLILRLSRGKLRLKNLPNFILGNAFLWKWRKGQLILWFMMTKTLCIFWILWASWFF